MAPNSSKDVTRVTRGQPKRLSPNFLRRNGRNVIDHVLISFHSRDVFRALSRLFVRLGFRLFCARLAVDYLAVYSVLGRLINLDFNGNGNGGCVSLRQYIDLGKPKSVASVIFLDVVNNYTAIQHVKQILDDFVVSTVSSQN